jgi:hypothetical protein
LKGLLESMAKEAMDSCYRSRSIDFGNRKFDTQGAVKLINGLIKRGRAVSEGDQLWSAVENFAEPLGLVRQGVLDRLDPGGSAFYREIRAKVEKHGGAGIEVRTVYNWFTGYDPNDGQESPGLTRRMVDIYLLCLAQQGVIRISRKKHGNWIDRSTIGAIDFKPEDLRNLLRIELPRPLEHWELFYPFIEVLTGAPEGSLGPRYDKATADEALMALWESHWLAHSDIERIDSDIKGLFTTLGMTDRNPFDDLLLYWMDFAEESRPKVFEEREVFDSLCRAVLAAAQVKEVGEITADHTTTFKSNHRRLKELQDSFAKTSLLLIRAAKLARAPLPEDSSFREIEQAQKEVMKQLESAADLVLNPDTVNTRLVPRLTQLEQLYVPAYLNELMRLEVLQNELAELAELIRDSDEIKAIVDFAGEVQEAKDIVEECQAQLQSLPPRLRKQPEDRDTAEIEVKREGRVKDTINNEEITFRRLATECKNRQTALEKLQDAAHQAMVEFAAFLRSPGILSRLQSIPEPTQSLTEILNASTDEEMAGILLKMPKDERKALAKHLKAVVGGKTAKTVSLKSFKPSHELIWEQTEIDAIVKEFRTYLQDHWEDNCYLKIEP